MHKLIRWHDNEQRPHQNTRYNILAILPKYLDYGSYLNATKQHFRDHSASSSSYSIHALLFVFTRRLLLSGDTGAALTAAAVELYVQFVAIAATGEDS